MKKLLWVVVLVGLAGSSYADCPVVPACVKVSKPGKPSIVSQRDIDIYNAKVRGNREYGICLGDYIDACRRELNFLRGSPGKESRIEELIRQINNAKKEVNDN